MNNSPLADTSAATRMPGSELPRVTGQHGAEHRRQDEVRVVAGERTDLCVVKPGNRALGERELELVGGGLAGAGDDEHHVDHAHHSDSQDEPRERRQPDEQSAERQATEGGRPGLAARAAGQEWSSSAAAAMVGSAASQARREPGDDVQHGKASEHRSGARRQRGERRRALGHRQYTERPDYQGAGQDERPHRRSEPTTGAPGASGAAALPGLLGARPACRRRGRVRARPSRPPMVPAPGAVRRRPARATLSPTRAGVARLARPA